jgi:NitT/TauT family transport system substrate-binding protein
MGSGSYGVAAMLDDEIDVSESAIFSLVTNAFKRQDFKIFSSVAAAGNDNIIIARKDRGIKTVKDLKGKRIGVLKGALPQYVLDLMLLKAGLTSKDVKIVLDVAKNLPLRISSGELDAVCIYGGWVDKISLALGANAVQLHDKGLIRVTVVLAAKSKKMAKNPEMFARLLRAYIKAEDYVRKNPDTALKTVVEELNLDMSNAREAWKPNLFFVGIDQSLVKDMENLARWQIDSGMHKGAKIPNILNFINFKVLESEDPGRVKVVHK